MQNKWVGYKRKLLELQDTLNRNPIQDAFIATAMEILLALLEDKIKQSAVCVGEVKLIVDDDVSAHTELTSK